MNRIFLALLLLGSLIVSACGGINSSQEKIAVVNWEQAAAAHPLQGKLKQGEAILKDLLQKRKAQEELARAQLSSLDRLRSLKKVSEKTYLTADFNTRMVGKQARENVKLQKFYAEADAEAEQLVAERRQEVEDTYRLKIFNLRMRLESVKMRPENRKVTEEELTAARAMREAELNLLQAEKDAYIQKKMEPHIKEMHKNMDAEAARLQAEIQEKMQQSEGKYADMFKEASPALSNALNIMDREIEKQQNKNEALKKQITEDIEASVMDLVKENGYTIVFNNFKVNIKADDITDKVINLLAKKHNK